MRGDVCRRCKQPLRLVTTEQHAATVLASLQRDARITRVVAYGGVFLASLIVGWVPMLATGTTALGMVAANLWLVRRPTGWLPVQHRMIVRLIMRVWFVLLLAVSVHANLVAAPLLAVFEVGIAVSTASGVLVVVAYVEGALFLVRHRVRRAVRRPDGDWGWLMVPVAMGVVGILAFLLGIPLLQRFLLD